MVIFPIVKKGFSTLEWEHEKKSEYWLRLYGMALNNNA